MAKCIDGLNSKIIKNSAARKSVVFASLSKRGGAFFLVQRNFAAFVSVLKGMTTSTDISTYQFEQSISLLRAIVLGHALLALLLLLPDFDVLTDYRAQICLSMVLVFGVLVWLYDWRSQAINVVAMVFYVAACVLEFTTLGLPASPLGGQDGTISKGILLTLIVESMPFIYAGIRVFLVLPLFIVLFRRAKLGE